jgi:micrococcal nuclease
MPDAKPAPVKPAYTYAAELVRVVDGDTYDLSVDLGFRVSIRIRARLLGVNCPEIRGPDPQAGIAARQATVEWFHRQSRLVIRSHKPADPDRDSFGRWLVEIHGSGLDSEHASLAEYLLSTHHAVPYKP